MALASAKPSVVNPVYGVDYGVADHVLGPYSDEGNESGPRVLRSVPGRLLGPGHNSPVLGPDGQTEYLVYHAWDRDMTMRQMHIDRGPGHRKVRVAQVRRDSPCGLEVCGTAE